MTTPELDPLQYLRNQARYQQEVLEALDAILEATRLQAAGQQVVGLLSTMVDLLRDPSRRLSTGQPSDDPSRMTASLPADQQVLGMLALILEATKAPPRRSTPAKSSEEILIRVVRVVTVGTPVQGPDIPVSAGYLVTVRQRQHAGAPVGRVGGSRNAVANDFERTQLQDGESVDFRITNLDKLWFDADTANTDFELIVEI